MKEKQTSVSAGEIRATAVDLLLGAARPKRKWQLMYSGSYMTVGVFKGATPVDVLDQYAKSKGYDSWKDQSEYLGLDPERYVVRDGFRIII